LATGCGKCRIEDVTVTTEGEIPMSERTVEQGLFACRVPAGSKVSVRVERLEDAHATFQAFPLYQPQASTATKFPEIRSPEMEDEPFTIEIGPNAFFRMIVEITHLSLEETTVVVRVEATDSQGQPVNDVDTGTACKFEGEYSGQLGTKGQDHLTIFVGGAS
jgi:hypothetical protein